MTYKNILYIYSCSLLAFCCACANANRTITKIPEVQIVGKADLVFPDDWLGTWVGELEIVKFDSVVQRIPMALDHARIDGSTDLTWAIIYGEDQVAGRRDYLLKEVDPDQGHYQVDEQNGIILDSYLFQNELISTFEVMGNLVVSKYIHNGDEITFEIIMSRQNQARITGDTIINNDTIPAVQSYPVALKQRAILSKK